MQWMRQSLEITGNGPTERGFSTLTYQDVDDICDRIDLALEGERAYQNEDETEGF